jgi:hypothetical protein
MVCYITPDACLFVVAKKQQHMFAGRLASLPVRTSVLNNTSIIWSWVLFANVLMVIDSAAPDCCLVPRKKNHNFSRRKKIGKLVAPNSMAEFKLWPIVFGACDIQRDVPSLWFRLCCIDSTTAATLDLNCTSSWLLPAVSPPSMIDLVEAQESVPTPLCHPPTFRPLAPAEKPTRNARLKRTRVRFSAQQPAARA